MAEKAQDAFDERIAFQRACQLLFDCGTDIFLQLFLDKVVHPRQLKPFLEQNKNKLLDHRLKTEIEETLFSYKKKNEKNWDIWLIKHIIITTHPEYNSCVSGLYDVRTILVHPENSAKLSRKQFEDVWKKTKDILFKALTFVNNGNLTKRIEKKINEIENDISIRNPNKYLKNLMDWNHFECYLLLQVEDAGKGMYRQAVYLFGFFSSLPQFESLFFNFRDIVIG